MEKKLNNQAEYKPKRDENGRLLPGNTANPNGRPKGKTMKEFARQFLMAMTDEKKLEFLNSLSKDIVWRMAEGNPAQDDNVAIKGNLVIEISKEGAEKYVIKPTSSDNTEG